MNTFLKLFPLALLSGCTNRISPFEDSKMIHMEIVVNPLRPAKFQLVEDETLTKGPNGRFVMVEKGGKIPVPVDLFRGGEFYNIDLFRDRSGRTIPRYEDAKSGELAFVGISGEGWPTKNGGYKTGQFISIKKKP